MPFTDETWVSWIRPGKLVSPKKHQLCPQWPSHKIQAAPVAPCVKGHCLYCCLHKETSYSRVTGILSFINAPITSTVKQRGRHHQTALRALNNKSCWLTSGWVMLPYDVGLWPTHCQAQKIDVAALVHRDVLRYVGDPGRHWGKSGNHDWCFVASLMTRTSGGACLHRVIGTVMSLKITLGKGTQLAWN